MDDTPALFEAVTFPMRAMDDRGLLVVLGLLLLGFTFGGTAMTLLGAWPVTLFAGVELALVAGLLLLYRRHALASRECVTLTASRLTIHRREGRRLTEASFDPYWARLVWDEDRLLVAHRNRRAEIGRFLPPDEKRDFQKALEAALHRSRTPRFDNPQLRPAAE